MVRMRRVTLAIGTAVSLLAALTVASVGAAGGFGEGTGTFTFDDKSAQVSLFNSADLSSEFVSVDRSLYLVKPKGGGTQTSQLVTILNASMFIPDPVDPNAPPVFEGFGCWVIPDSAFVISSDLQHASLNVTVDDTTPSCAFDSVVPVLSVGEGPKAGGGGGGGFPLPLTITATWTGNGVLTSSENQGSTMCLRFHTLNHIKGQSGISSSAAMNLSSAPAFTATNSFGSVSVNHVVLQVNGSGVLSPECGGKGKG